MLNAILNGILLGLVLAMLVGPVFFLLIDTSIKRGVLPAVVLSAGVVISDALFVVVTYFSSAALGTLRHFEREFGIASAILLVFFGILSIVKRPDIKSDSIEVVQAASPMYAYFLKGFFANMLNPFVLVFWLGVSGTLTAEGIHSDSHTVIFFLAVLLIVFCTDILKAWLAHRLRRILRPGILLWVNRISGLGLLAFGLQMLWKVMSY